MVIGRLPLVFPSYVHSPQTFNHKGVFRYWPQVLFKATHLLYPCIFIWLSQLSVFSLAKWHIRLLSGCLADKELNVCSAELTRQNNTTNGWSVNISATRKACNIWHISIAVNWLCTVCIYWANGVREQWHVSILQIYPQTTISDTHRLSPINTLTLMLFREVVHPQTGRQQKIN